MCKYHEIITVNFFFSYVYEIVHEIVKRQLIRNNDFKFSDFDDLPVQTGCEFNSNTS